MIESYIDKLIFIDDQFMRELDEESVADLIAFENPDPDTKVITLPMAPEKLLELEKYIDISEVKVGNILVKPGYSNRFIRIEEFAEDYTIRKYRLWIQLCVALGAKKVSINNIEDVFIGSSEDSTLNVGASGKAPGVGGHSDAGYSKSSREDEIRKSIMNISAEAAGSTPNLVAAENILQRYKLFTDDMFVSIYEMRELGFNPLTKHEFQLDFSKDIKKVFDTSIKAKLEVMSKVYKGRVAFDSKKNAFNNARTAMKLTISVEF
jgi:hypothetical protein